MDEVLLKLYGSILCRMKQTYSVVYHSYPYKTFLRIVKFLVWRKSSVPKC
jgi:hypothetical protein